MGGGIEEKLQQKLREIASMVQEEGQQLKAEREAIEADRAQLEEERATFEAEKEMVAAANKVTNSKLKLDVGGTVYHVSRTTLTFKPGSMLEAMFSGRHELQEDEEKLQQKLKEIASVVQEGPSDRQSRWIVHSSKRSATFEAEKEMVAEANKVTNSKVKLDVGSTGYHASRTTLTSKSGSMLEAMFSGRHELHEDEDGRVFTLDSLDRRSDDGVPSST